MKLNTQQNTAVKNLLYKMADDLLILGHRNSEWTGLGPILEEDIAFSSMAQDKIGQAQALYAILHQLGENDPDTIAFTRDEKDYKCCQLVEYPIGEYDFSLMRHFLFDHSNWLRFDMLVNSNFEPLAQVARKFRGEIKYHVMHADTWIEKLATGNEESKARMQTALNECFHLALGIFEQGKEEETLKSSKIFEGEVELQKLWFERISTLLTKAGLQLPEEKDWKPALGGRFGYHTEHLQPLLNEMTEVFRIDPGAEW